MHQINTKTVNSPNFKKKRARFKKVMTKKEAEAEQIMQEISTQYMMNNLPEDAQKVVKQTLVELYVTAERVAFLQQMYTCAMVLDEEMDMNMDEINKVLERMLDHYSCTITGHVKTVEIMNYVHEKSGISFDFKYDDLEFVDALQEFYSLVAKNMNIEIKKVLEHEQTESV